jgi:ubiquinone/menaquinone biosynthesis C-methylase UbiE
MNLSSHRSAKPSHYNKQAKYYDAFNQDNWVKQVNQTLEKILAKYRINSVLDLTCGTGSQVFWLAQRGYKVVGADFNSRMLSIAKNKAAKNRVGVKFLKGDMRTLQAGKFDAVITIANAIGHLAKRDFEKALRNIHDNLKTGGLYIFDINNLAYLLQANNITNLTIDWCKRVGDVMVRDIQYSTVNKEGVLASYTTSYVQRGSKQPVLTKNAQTLQVYTAKQLREILRSNGFKMLRHYGIDGSKFHETKTEAILTVAQKL